VKQRLRVLEFAREIGLRAASRRFGISRNIVRQWKRRYEAEGVLGLVPRYPATRKSPMPAEIVDLLRYARSHLEYGAARTRVWLRRVHSINLYQETIQRAFRRMGLPYLPKRAKRRSRPRQMKLFEKDEPGDSVQLDVKFVRVEGKRRFQYTALDDCSRFRVLRVFSRHHVSSSLRFFSHVRKKMPFTIRKVQVDHGHEFPLEFELELKAAGIDVRRIQPRRPQQNGKVERSHRIDDEEFWCRHPNLCLDGLDDAVEAWERHYNFVRFSLALKGLTPAERLADRLAAPPLALAPPPGLASYPFA